MRSFSSSPLLAVPARLAALAAGSLLAAACGGAPATARPPAPIAPPPVASVAPAPPDPLGPRPEPAMPATFLPPAPVVYTATNGITVWLLERHQAPVVSCQMVVPTGASSDPPAKGGLAYVTANMMDEGAGKRGAIDVSRALDDLGAQLDTDANADTTWASLTVLTRHLREAFSIYGDVVARPRFEAKELARVKDLWSSELLERSKDPDATARVVFRAALFGAGHPYAHPWDGTLTSSHAVTLDDVKRFYQAEWRPDRATLVCAGDVTKEALAPLLEEAF
ncbi:MAG TPA: pitrilysin family protein, partial [Polyangiaceae bacterium]